MQTFRGVRVSGLNEGNWWKFSTSNNRSSAGLHRTRYNLCARIESNSAQNSMVPLYEVSLPILFFPILIYRLERKREGNIPSKDENISQVAWHCRSWEVRYCTLCNSISHEPHLSFHSLFVTPSHREDGMKIGRNWLIPFNYIQEALILLYSEFYQFYPTFTSFCLN